MASRRELARTGHWLLVAVLVSASTLSVSPETELDCREVRTPQRLRRGESFRAPLAGRLEFRLLSDPSGFWSISVGPVGTTDDYVWLVSPPLRTAPHLQIGPGYGLTAAQSVALDSRRFGFVTNAAEYKAAERLIEVPTITADDLKRQARGTLDLWITGWEATANGDGLVWISVRARACQPRQPAPMAY